MTKTTLASLFSSLSMVGLFVASCGTPARHFENGAGSGGEGDAATSGGTSTAGDGGTGTGGTMPSANAGAVSVGGDNADGSSGAGGQGLGECSAEQKLCSDVCVNIDDPAYGCGAQTCDAATCPSQSTGATLVCEGSDCVVGTCPTGYKNCDNKCVAISDPTYGCGATTCDASSCPPAGAGTLVCQDSTCVVGTCGAGTKKCGSNCVTTDANNGCADEARCTACANNESCSGTPSTCQCVPTPMATACSGKNCGSVSNGCGGMYTCGTCSSSTAPICVSNTCKQCGTLTDCPLGTFNCTNNTCKCRVANSANVIKDGGFDSASVLSQWTSNTAVWTNSDADECPASGSVTVTGTMNRCIQVPVAGPGTSYSLGIHYKGNGVCGGGYFVDGNCMTLAGPGFLLVGSEQSATWVIDRDTQSVPEGTSSISLECQSTSSMTIDQIFLSSTGYVF